tara:strand:- start:4949 stop:5683 length:735 start_codon:yes stop_codon:yes gene_type:complete
MEAIPNYSIDLIFVDLPFGCLSCDWDIPIDLEKMWFEFMRIKKDNTPIFFTTTTKYGVNLINSAPKICPYRYDVCYITSASSGFLRSRHQPLRKHGLVYVFYEYQPLYDLSSHKHKFIRKGETNAQPKYNPPLPTSVYQGNPTKYHSYPQAKNNESIYTPPLPNSVLEIDSERSKHSTQKATELIRFFLKYYSKEGDVVLDNCMGSGSTGVACIQMNRRFIGMELDKDIFKVAEERINEETKLK